MMLSRLMVGVVTLATAVMVTPASADVVDRATNGFTVKTVVTIAASPDRAFLALVNEIDTWWSNEHTWSGQAGNLWLTPNPGGCFCETLENGGGAAHAVVNHVVPGQILRMTGALGPLQAAAVTGTLTWQFEKSGDGTTATVTYAVSGFHPGGLEALAAPVDGVIGEQLRRLKAHLEPERK